MMMTVGFCHVKKAEQFALHGSSPYMLLSFVNIEINKLEAIN